MKQRFNNKLYIIKRLTNMLINDRLIYSLIFCIKHLPYRQAIKLPIIFSNGAYAKIDKGGKIILSDKFFEKRNRILIGVRRNDFEYQCEKTYIDLKGKIAFNGSLTACCGTPAKLLKERIVRVWDTNREKEYHNREFIWYKEK